MIVVAPGKLVLTGAYAVLEGAPAIVVAVDRLAACDTDRAPWSDPPRELRCAFGTGAAPYVDTSALYDGENKLGLGSSAAALVAALASRHARRFECIASPSVRREIFFEARAAHAEAQGGGSGIDVAASVWGGALRYRLRRTSRGEARPSIASLALPSELKLAVFFGGTPARTSDLLSAVDTLRVRKPLLHRGCMDELHAAAERAATSLERGRIDSFLLAVQNTRRGLARLGLAAEVPIVPPAFAEIAACAAMTGAVFLPSGAGGGDVGVFLGKREPSPELLALAARRGMKRIPIGIDREGVRVAASALSRRAS